MTWTRADQAAANLHAMIVQAAAKGPLAGVQAEVSVQSGRRLCVTVERLPLGAVEAGPQGLAPTAVGARITDLLHVLAQRACGQAGVTRPSLFRIRPAALAAAVSTPPIRRAS